MRQKGEEILSHLPISIRATLGRREGKRKPGALTSSLHAQELLRHSLEALGCLFLRGWEGQATLGFPWPRRSQPELAEDRAVAEKALARCPQAPTQSYLPAV